MKSVLEGISTVDGGGVVFVEMISNQECWKGWNPGSQGEASFREEGRIEGGGGVWERCFA